ncbi:MAG: hypothetical protein MJ114_06635 [Acetatifactor sp.]|nr:hypothetical protein [Acetatifactor sp.]
MLGSIIVVVIANISVTAVKRKKLNIPGVLLLFMLLASVMLMRYSVGYYSIYNETAIRGEGDVILTPVEEIFNSVVHTFQSFSMDESYTEYVQAGREMMIGIYGEDSYWIRLFGLLTSVVNVLAPVIGGAIVLTVLQSVFPGIRAFRVRKRGWSDRYYFSELNERSMTLAKDILNQKYPAWKRPQIVFTNVHADNEEGGGSELSLEAKELGMYCFESDIVSFTCASSRIHKNKSKTIGPFCTLLINEDEMSNIMTLAKLLSEENWMKFTDEKQKNIYIFYSDDDLCVAEKTVWDGMMVNLEAEQKKAKQKKSLAEMSPMVTRVKGYQRLVYNLLKEYPLYRPLVKNAERRDSLDVAIIGNGKLGMEAFLGAYWSGQLLDQELSISMVSLDDEETACMKIDRINPEILMTAQEGHEILRRDPEDPTDVNRPYFTFRYASVDMTAADFSAIVCKEPECIKPGNGSTKSLLDSDYYIVNLGSDELNIKTAERLAREIIIKQTDDKTNRNVTIMYVVYDSGIAKILNSNPHRICSNEYKDVVELIACGTIDEIYNYESVFEIDKKKRNNSIKDKNLKISRGEAFSNAQKRFRESYNAQSTDAHNIHWLYKCFTAYRNEVLTGKPVLSGEARKIWERERARILGKAVDEAETADEKYSLYICENKNEMARRLAALEHRRWSAFMRSIGFRQRKYTQEDIQNKSIKSKDIFIKRHTCLVECYPYDLAPEKMDGLDKIEEHFFSFYKKYDYHGCFKRLTEEIKDSANDKVKAISKDDYYNSADNMTGYLSVLDYFDEIISLPCSGGNTKHIRNYILEVAKKRGFEAKEQGKDIVLTTKKDDKSTICLECLYDLNIKALKDCSIDIQKEGIIPVLDVSVVTAKGTTLGGKIGVSLALALAILDATRIKQNVQITFKEKDQGKPNANRVDELFLKNNDIVNGESFDLLKLYDCWRELLQKYKDEYNK